MHVCHIMADGNSGGGPTVVLTLCGEFAARGHRVTVVTQQGSPLQAQCVAGGIPVRGYDFAGRLEAVRRRSDLRALFGEIAPDIVHAHGARSALPVATLRAPSRPGFVYTVHGFHHRTKGTAGRIAGRAVERFCIARANATVFVSENDARQAVREGLRSGGVAQVIYNGVAVPGDLMLAEEAREVDLLFMARLVPQKDPLILPDILRAMRPLRPSLLIVGSGELEGALREKIAEAGVGEQVTLRPAVAREEALRLMARARVYLLPSRWEGLPVSVVEAMRLRVAVLASDVPGTDEIVADGSTGLLAPPGDGAAFARQAAALLSDAVCRRGLAEAAAQAVADRFSTIRQADEHLALYRTVIAR